MINKLLVKKLLLQINFDVRNVLRKLLKNKRNNHFFRQFFLQSWVLKLLQIAQKCYQKEFLKNTCLREGKRRSALFAGGPAVVGSLVDRGGVAPGDGGDGDGEVCRALLFSSSSSSGGGVVDDDGEKIETEKKSQKF